MRIGELELDDKTLSQTNMLILGSPGLGKSFKLEFLMREFLALRQPFCFIGLHSRSYENMVRWCAYNEYYDRKIVLIDPSDGEYAKGVNFFRPIEGVSETTWVGSLVDAVMGALGANPNDNAVI